MVNDQAALRQAVQLPRTRVVDAHRYPLEIRRSAPCERNDPESAVVGQAEHCSPVIGGDRPAGCLDDRRVELGSVHADQHRGAGHVGERGPQATVETPLALGNHLPILRQPGSGSAVEHQQVTIGGYETYRVQGIEQGTKCDVCRLVRAARRAQAGLDTAWHGCLRQHDRCKCRTSLLSHRAHRGSDPCRPRPSTCREAFQ